MTSLLSILNKRILVAGCLAVLLIPFYYFFHTEFWACWLMFAWVVFINQINDETRIQVGISNMWMLSFPIGYFAFPLVALHLVAFVYYFVIMLVHCGNDCVTNFKYNSENQVLKSMIETQQLELNKLKEQCQQNTGNYGLGVAQLPQGGYKLCRIFAKLHDGTTATFHTIGLEHQVKELTKNDPRFEWADVSIDDPAEWGRYGLYG